MRKRMYTTGLAVMCGLVLTATGLWASAASEAEPAAAADREMVRDPATGEMILKPQYGGSIADAWVTDDGLHTDTWFGGGNRGPTNLVLEVMGMGTGDWTGMSMTSSRLRFLNLLLDPTLPRASKFLPTAELLPSTSVRAFTGRTRRR